MKRRLIINGNCISGQVSVRRTYRFRIERTACGAEHLATKLPKITIRRIWQDESSFWSLPFAFKASSEDVTIRLSSLFTPNYSGTTVSLVANSGKTFTMRYPPLTQSFLHRHRCLRGALRGRRDEPRTDDRGG